MRANGAREDRMTVRLKEYLFTLELRLEHAVFCISVTVAYLPQTRTMRRGDSDISLSVPDWKVGCD